ncbi:carboxylesterase [Talaromyces proteolyticus]|uniref:Carboxylic ester hydrolase n=1 Tax=Talaromyces proteolyticus TaxID=1131652 RepID=A0AAD4KTH2_9EURO|nr:carboxylesterase [Talaromyces proteolyticus]KAH8697917.1 carboxylesterase [Talaromyces proteolyticus]
MDIYILILNLLLYLLWATADNTNSLPIVDLGYIIQQATLNLDEELYNFSNIQYATAPLFAAPQNITTIHRCINSGQVQGICPQSTPWWQVLGSDPHIFNTVSAHVDPRTVQECLTLDVIVPTNVWNRHDFKGKYYVPVLVWIHGGGYVSGDKNSAGNPNNLINQSVTNSSSGIVFVSLNYRLGMFGWLSGPKFQSEGGISNIGLRDQRAGLEWVKRYIHLFGGDAGRITVMGESAGAGSIMHHLIAEGGKLKAPFSQAIIQSPALAPVPSTEVQDYNFDMVLKWASILTTSQLSTLEDLKNVPFTTLLQINQVTTAPSYWGSMTWGPTVDGRYVPKMPGVLFQQGHFDHSIKVVTGHNSHEGRSFGSPLVTDESQYLQYLRELLPSASADIINYLDNHLYSQRSNWSNDPNRNERDRLINTITDYFFICNNRYIDTAYQDIGSWGYYFDVPPGVHAQDLAYTFYNPGADSKINVTIARQMQSYFANFIQTGDPNAPGLPTLVSYREGSMLRSLHANALVKDTAATDRCAWWQQALYA